MEFYFSKHLLGSEMKQPTTLEIKPVSQIIDNYGKLRQLNIDYNGSKISVLTEPLPPLAVPIEKEKIYKTTTDIISNLPIINLTGQNSMNGKVIFVYGTIGNVKVSIPIESGNELKLPYQSSELFYPYKQISYLDEYNNNKKLARYLTEYIFWYFSKFLEEEKINIVVDKTINTFSEKRMKVDDNHVYDNIQKYFDMESSVFKGNKFIVQSDEMKRRMLYILKLYSIRDWNSLRQYHKRKVIQQYYKDITDFSSYPQQILLEGTDAVDKWIQERNNILYVYENVQIGQQSPYFFHNDNIDENVYIAQNTSDLNTALDVSYKWYQDNFNYGYYGSGKNIKDLNLEFTLYNYSSSDEIVIKKVKGKLKANSKIIGYKLNNTPRYTCLLELN